jgi:hypothetical protein
VEHPVLKTKPVLHNDHLKYFYGTAAEAYKAALLDNDQYEVEQILAYRGDPHMRTTMEFFIQFKDGKPPVWQTWSRDLFNSIPYL